MARHRVEHPAPPPRSAGSSRRRELSARDLLTWGALAVLLALVIAVPGLRRAVLTGAQAFDVARFEALMRRWGVWAPLASVLLMVLHTVLPFPAELLTAANGLLFGVWGGLAVSWIGAMAGACVGFGVARGLGRRAVERFVPERTLAPLDGLMHRAGWEAALMLRLIPAVSFNLVNFALGFTPLPWITFLWTTAVGILPVEVTVVAAGYGAGHASQVLWGALAVFAALIAGGLAVRRRLLLRGRRGTERDAGGREQET